MARAHGSGGTGVRMFQTVEKTCGIAAQRLVTGGRAMTTAGATGKTAERRIRIAGGVGVPTQRISRATADTGVTIKEISKVPGDTRAITARISKVIGEFAKITEEIFRVTGDCGVITKGISEPIAVFDGTTNDIILQGWIAGIGPLRNITGMETRAGPTKREAAPEPTDDSVMSRK